MKLLFITRDYPPQVGGRAVFSYNFDKNIKEECDLTTINLKTRGSSIKKEWSDFGWALRLLWFIPYAFIKSLLLSRKKDFDFIILGDTLLAPIGSLLKKLTNTRVVVYAHGFDIIRDDRVWQLILRRNLKKMDKVIAVSHELKKEVVKRGVAEDDCLVLLNSINKDEFYIDESKEFLKNRLPSGLKSKIKDRKVLLSVGRFVKRKGFNWFTSKVMPRLDDYCYLIVGDGPEMKKVNESIKRHGLTNRVRTLGIVDKELLKLLYNIADVFVMPNLKLENNIEGFGMVVIEAGSCDVPVVASNIDGIKDAVIDNKTGFLVKERSVKEFIKGVRRAQGLTSVREEVVSNYSWSKTVIKIREMLESI